MATIKLDTLQFPADSADTFGGAISAFAEDGSALDVTTFQGQVALVARSGHPQADPVEADWHDATWHTRKGKTWADVTNGVGGVAVVKGTTYAVFAGVMTLDGLVYRQVGWLKPT